VSKGAHDNFAFMIKIVGLMIYSLLFVWFLLLFLTFFFSSLLFLSFSFLVSLFLLHALFKFFFPIVLFVIGKTCFHNSQGIMLRRIFFHSTNFCWL
jgi:hypothetical protein